MTDTKPMTADQAIALNAEKAKAASQAQALAVAIEVHGVDPSGQTHVVPLPASHAIDWSPRRKIWVGSSVGTLAVATTAVGVWVAKVNGLVVPVDVGSSIGVLVTGAFTLAASFITSYWVKEPPTQPP